MTVVGGRRAMERVACDSCRWKESNGESGL